MADSRVINLTAADSSATWKASSVFFLAIAPDDTALAVPASELGQRVSDIGGFLMWRETDQKVRIDSVRERLNIDSPLWDIGGWWDPASPNIVTCPNDSYRSMQFTWYFNSDAAGIGVRQSGIRYTTVTSTKYSQEFPEIWQSGAHSNKTAALDKRPAQNSEASATSGITLPVECESGDQFEVYVLVTGTTSPTVFDLSFGGNPVGRYL